MGNHLLESFFLFGSLPAHLEKGTISPLLVFLSYIIASFAAYTGLSIADLIPSAQTALKKNILRGLGAFAYGGGFWSMHLVGLLSVKTQIETLYHPWFALLFLLFSFVMSFFVLIITRVTSAPSLLRISIGASALGISICILHYTGMWTQQITLSLSLAPFSFALSAMLAILASGIALVLVFRLGPVGKKRRILWRIVAALIMGVGICGSFYLGLRGALFPSDAAPQMAMNEGQHYIALTILALTTILLFILTFAISNRIFLTVGCGALFALPLIIIIHQAVSTLNMDVDTIKKEQFGLVYYKDLSLLLRGLQDRRDISFLNRLDEPGFSALLADSDRQIGQTLSKIDSFAAANPDNKDIVLGWESLKKDLFPKTEQRTTTPDDAYRNDTSRIHALINYINDVANITNLSTNLVTGNKDPLLDYSVHSMPQLWETASLARTKASRLLTARFRGAAWDNVEKQEVKNLFFLLDGQDISFENVIERLKGSHPNASSLFAYNEGAIEPIWRKLSANVGKMVEANERTASSADIFFLATTFMDSFAPFYDEPAETFYRQLEEQEAAYIFSRNLMIYSSAAAFLGFIGLFVFLNRSLLKTESAQRIAIQTQQELAARLIEKEHLEHRMQDYTDSLELSRFDVMAANTRLQEEEAKLRAIMENVLEGIIAVSDNGTIQTFNKAAEHVFGYAAEEVIGKNASLLLPAENAVPTEVRMKRYVSTRENGIIGVEREIHGRRKDGSVFPMITTISEVMLDKTRLFITLVRDITLQKQKEEDLLRMKERAETANKTKSDFLANMSHELRTPLNSVYGMTRLLLGTRLTTEQQELANTVLMSSTNLMEIVNDILDLSKIEAGEVEMEHIGFDPHEIFHSVVLSLAHAAREKRLPIVRLYENETFPYLLGDPLRLGRVITNLLSNAIKYTEIGHIEVRAHTKELDDKHAELYCEVTDTGIGIPLDKQQSVFDKFVQADSSTTRKYGGTGLGLAITRELVLKMGGEIGVNSEIDMGSTFWFRVPFEITDKLHEEKQHRRLNASVGVVPPEKARVLVAEDHPMNQLLIKRLLDKFGIGTIEIVANGNEVLTAYEENSWTAILMDCHMPEKNGYDATATIRDIEKTTKAHVPIIAMTANAMVGDREKCIRCGMDEYVSKPINIEELRAVLSQWVAFADVPSLDNRGDFMTEETPPVDLTMLRTLTGGDADVEKELMKTFVDQSDKNLATMKENSNAEGENKPWSEAAHMLKGGSGSIGAEELRRLCSDAQLYKGDSFGRLSLLQSIMHEYERVKEHLKKEGLL